MGIGINNPGESTAKTTTKAAMIGALGGGAYKLGKTHLAPIAQDSFKSYKSSINTQTKLIDKVKDGVEEYIAKKSHDIPLQGRASSIFKTAKLREEQYIKQGLKGEELAAEFNEFLGKLDDQVAKVTGPGVDKSLKNLEQEAKMLRSGKPSKTIASKDAFKTFKAGISEKAKAAREGFSNLKEGFKGAESKTAYLKENVWPAVKKYGKPALIGAAVVGGLALVTKAILNRKAEKTEEAE